MSRSDRVVVPKSRLRVWLGRLGVLALLALLATGIGAFVPNWVQSPSSVKHLTHVVTRGTLLLTVTENGSVESSNNKEIKCMVKGGSTVLWVIETGTLVKPGDELVRLDQSQIEDKILQQQIVYENALASKITAESDVAVAEISMKQYLEGTYQQDRATMEKDIFEAEQTLRKKELAYSSALRLTAKGVVKDLQLEGERFAVDSAKKDLQMKQTKLDSLEKYDKEKMLQELRSKLRAAQAKLASSEASLSLEKARLDREKQQLENCVIRAETEGMVIFPSMAAWKDTPDITEGAVVREQQTLLMIPDVSKMQVKVGIHESKVDRLIEGMPAKVQMQDLVLDGEVSEIAEVTRPAGWWTGNLVKYDTKIRLTPHEGLKPGMSAVVDIELARHENVLTIPVACIVENEKEAFCWVQTPEGVKKRVIRLGDTNDEFTIVVDGLNEGEAIVLNPLAFIDEAQTIAIQPTKDSKADASKENKEESSKTKGAAEKTSDKSSQEKSNG